MNSTYLYPTDAFEDVYRWVHEIGCGTPTEINLLLKRDESMLASGPIIILNATAFADSEDRGPRSPFSLRELSRPSPSVGHSGERTDDDGRAQRRFGSPLRPGQALHCGQHVDSCNPSTICCPGLREIVRTLPPAPSHMEMFNWGHVHSPKRPAMAYSLEDDFYYAIYAAWDDPADDDKYRNWVTERMRALEPFASGTQLADENLINRPFRFVTDESLRRLDELRIKYDPQGLFLSWLGRPW